MIVDLEGNELSSALASFIGGGASIEGLTRLSGGASKQTWQFDAVGADGERSELILRRDVPGRPGEPGDVRREARALRLAHGAGLPVPEILARSERAGWGTPGMVLRRIPGETIARKILRDEQYEAARGVLVHQLARFAAGLHAIEPPAGFPGPDPLAALREQLEAFAVPRFGQPSVGQPSSDQPSVGQPSVRQPSVRQPSVGHPSSGQPSVRQHSPVFEQALAWLAANPPPSRAPVLLHGDFRLGNLIVGPEGLRAVLDWELTHLGNPAEDLGWLCVKAWRFGAAGAVAGLSSREELLAAYREAGGADIGLDELRWWEVLGTLRWGVICLSQAWTHLSGAHRSVELAAIGRRVCEQEWDLLLLLEPDAAAAAAAAAAQPRASGAARGEPAPHGRPTASELLEAVREFLTGQVMPATSGQLAFHARVAANVLAIVARELELGPPPAGVGPADAVAARLAVANPAYFDPPLDIL
jgi:aminoglycoside phosphotransferase (APT) family kinase protein